MAGLVLRRSRSVLSVGDPEGDRGLDPGGAPSRASVTSREAEWERGSPADRW
jgi:hypothetical protein